MLQKREELGGGGGVLLKSKNIVAEIKNALVTKLRKSSRKQMEKNTENIKYKKITEPGHEGNI